MPSTVPSGEMQDVGTTSDVGTVRILMWYIMLLLGDVICQGNMQLSYIKQRIMQHNVICTNKASIEM